MRNILLYNPAITSTNLGDYVISDSAHAELDFLLNDSFCSEVSTHLPLSWYYMRLFKDVDYSFVLGSNLLKSTFFGFKRQWAVSFFTSPLIHNCVLVGVGWWQYNNAPNLYTKTLYKRILSDKYIHSVRDSYTEKILNNLGIRAINTGCPSVWSLTEEHCKLITNEKSDSVIFTVTDYDKDPQKDGEMIEILISNYRDIYFWPQGYHDISYVSNLCDISKIHIVRPSLSAYDELLNKKIDYVGTRLHGGIRAIQKCKRAIIICIDNRAKEMHEDFNIPIIPRDNISSLKNWISRSNAIDIHIPVERINSWKDQFIK